MFGYNFLTASQSLSCNLYPAIRLAGNEQYVTPYALYCLEGRLVGWYDYLIWEGDVLRVVELPVGWILGGNSLG